MMHNTTSKDPQRAASLPRTVMKIASEVHRRIMHTVGAAEPESGGILLGPRGGQTITEFFLDEEGRCSGVTYAPGHRTLNRLLLEVWRPAGLDMLGFVHSHPESYVHPSGGDLAYIRRIFEHNPGMHVFFAPIVIPARFWFRPFVVHRQGLRVEEALLDVLD